MVVVWLPYYKQPSRKLVYIQLHTQKKILYEYELYIILYYYMPLAAAQDAFQIFATISFTCGPIAPWFMAALCSLWAMPIKECLLW